MSGMQMLTLRTFVNERLTAAAEEILGVIERTMVEYREEVSRAVVYQCKLKRVTHQTEPKQLTASGCKEDGLPEQQNYPPLPPQIKEEQGEEPVQGPEEDEEDEEDEENEEEADILKFIFTHPPTVTQGAQVTSAPVPRLPTPRLGNSHRAPPAISAGPMKMEADDEGDCGTWETHDGCQIFNSDETHGARHVLNSDETHSGPHILNSDEMHNVLNSDEMHNVLNSHTYNVTETRDDYFRKESAWPRSHFDTHRLKNKWTTQTSCMVSNEAHLSYSTSPTDCEMSTAGKERTARYRARLNADPSTREHLLAKRRASYQVRKMSGLIDRTSIKDMSSEAQNKTRRMWRLAKQKQRERMSHGTLTTGRSLSLEEDSSSSLIDDQGSPLLWIPAAYEHQVQRGNQT